MKIYTRTGDKGKTSLFNGTRVDKNNIRVESYGAIDELNSIVGVCISFLAREKSLKKSGKTQIQTSGQIGPTLPDKIKKELQQVQHDLFDIGAVLANPVVDPSSDLMTHWTKRIKEFESLIDSLTAQLTVLSSFILPGGSEAGALLHLSRTSCRRVERTIITLSQSEKVPNEIIVYINRLSDLFFTMSRYINHIENQQETSWKKNG